MTSERAGCSECKRHVAEAFASLEMNVDAKYLTAFSYQGAESDGLRRCSIHGSDFYRTALSGRAATDDGTPIGPETAAMKPEFVVQTRDESGELLEWPSVSAAFRYAEEHPTVEKVSWPDADGSRVRMVRQGTGWRFEPLMDVVREFLDRAP